MRTAASKANSWRSSISASVSSCVVLLQRQHAEGDVAGLVAHDVAEQLLEQRLGGHLVHEAEGGQRQALDHDLHAQVGHVPAAVLDDVVEQQAQVGVDRVVAVELGVEVLGEDLDVAGLVHHLGGGVVLGVDPRHGLDDLGGADQRALLAVHELAERSSSGTPCRAAVHSLSPQLANGVPATSIGIAEAAERPCCRVATCSWSTSISHGEVGLAVPLRDLGLLVQLVERRAGCPSRSPT